MHLVKTTPGATPASTVFLLVPLSLVILRQGCFIKVGDPKLNSLEEDKINKSILSRILKTRDSKSKKIIFKKARRNGKELGSGTGKGR